MERGPAALFGAIVAVGLGPALWLGAQIGNITVIPTRPPAVISEQQPGRPAPGGAGVATDRPAVRVQDRPRPTIVPLSSSPSARPPSSSSPVTSEQAPVASSPGPPAPSASPSATTGEPSDPPTGTTTEPPAAGDATGGGDQADPTTPPVVGDENPIDVDLPSRTPPACRDGQQGRRATPRGSVAESAVGHVAVAAPVGRFNRPTGHRRQ